MKKLNLIIFMCHWKVMMSQGYLRVVLRVFQVFQGFTRVFTDCSKVSKNFHGAIRKFQMCFRKVSRVFQKCSKGHSSKFQWRFDIVSRKFQFLLGWFKVVMFPKVYCCIALISSTQKRMQTDFFKYHIWKRISCSECTE